MTPDVVFVVHEHVRRPELQYALRSWSLVPHSQVWFVGGLPDWVRNVNHVPFPDSEKWRNISDKFRSLHFLDGLADWFYYTEDDYFILQPQERIPHYVHKQSLRERVHGLETKQVRRKPLTGWKGYLTATLDVLVEAGVEDPLSYDVHVPLLVEKAKLPVHLESRWPVSWRSLYGNFSGLPSQPIKTDVKSHHSAKAKVAQETGFLSSAEGTFRKSGVEATLQKLFPEPSPYEKEID